MHMYIKYEVSMSNPVPGEVCTDANADANEADASDDDAQWTIHDCIRLFG